MAPRVFRTQDTEAEATRGLLLAYSDILGGSFEDGYIYARRPNPKRVVALISGGGSGHEPMHVGFVGRGLLDAACMGRIFVSAHNKQVTAAALHVRKPGGVLFVVKNYTGDTINFSVAAERLQNAGVVAKCLVVGDDIASDDKAVGRRGTAAPVIVEKLLAGAADEGLGLDELMALGNEIVANSHSLSVATRGPSLPGTDHETPVFTAEAGLIEYGLGIHGERGICQVPFESVDQLVDRMLPDLMAKVLESDVNDEVVTPCLSNRNKFSDVEGSDPELPNNFLDLRGRRNVDSDCTALSCPVSSEGDGGYLLFVNGLGNCTEIEMLSIYSLASQWMYARGYNILASLVGSLCTALDCHGFSLTVVKFKYEWLPYWYADTEAPRFPRLPLPRQIPTRHGRKSANQNLSAVLSRKATESESPHTTNLPASAFQHYPSVVLRRLALAFHHYRAGLDNLDRVAGDGDFGSTISGGVNQALRLFVERGAEANVKRELEILGETFCNSVGGSAGALLGLLFENIAVQVSRDGQNGWLQGLTNGINAVQRVGKAREGDCTMLDALIPARNALEEHAGSQFCFREATIQAIIGMMATKTMHASRGRACYLGQRTLGFPDPGAAGICIFLGVIASEACNSTVDDLWQDFDHLLSTVPNADRDQE